MSRIRSGRRILPAALVTGMLAAGLLLAGCNSPSGSSSGDASTPVASSDEGKLTYVQIDVGQGDSELLVSPDGHAMLVDAGLPGNESKILDVLQAHGVKSLDYLVESHPHADHIGSMRAVIEQGPPVDLFLASGYRHNSAIQTRLLEAVRDRVRNRGRYVKRGDSLRLGQSVTLDVLQPQPPFLQGTDSDPNNNSVVLRVGYGEVHLLLTGDMEEPERERLYASGADLRSDILKVAHHGSHNGTDDELLRRVRPRYALVSCGVGNDYGHPHREALDALNAAGVRIYRTDLQGDLTLHTDGHTIEVARARSSPVALTLDGHETAAKLGGGGGPARSESRRSRRAPSNEYAPPGPSGGGNAMPASGGLDRGGSPEGAQADSGEASGPIVGNRRTRVYHRADSGGNLPSLRNRVYFQSETEAEAAGYRPALR